ncbi:MAG: hypothetical protein R2882_01280 [Gemmatimonadales bacterium]
MVEVEPLHLGLDQPVVDLLGIGQPAVSIAASLACHPAAPMLVGHRFPE